MSNTVPPLSQMRREVDEIPEVARRLIEAGDPEIEAVAASIRALRPRFVATIARGSSDNAALFLKYAIERIANLPVASLGPSLASVYGATPHLEQGVVFAISQSGESPDIVAMAKVAADGGGETIALTNTPRSPLALQCHHRVDIGAGIERSVAATKSFVNSVIAGLIIVAHWTENDTLMAALKILPDHLAAAMQLAWTPLEQTLADARSFFVIGRGPAMAIASEAALKFKEVCGLHAEAYSSAEVLHGPIELVGPDFPVLAMTARDAGEDSVIGIADLLASQGVRAAATSQRVHRATPLPFVATGHPLTDALTLIVPLYGFVERWSRKIGREPDKPTHLKKVTQTL
jgi:glucosamine--fructose-6-phosphate aminotransferase (isomerizing)